MDDVKSLKIMYVLRKSQAKEFQCDKPWACISISCPDDEKPKISKVRQVGYLHLEFWDAESPREDYEPQHIFSKEMANKVWDFVEEMWDKVEVFMFHCLMGQSRSPAIAAAISKVRYGEDHDFFEYHTPNMVVYRIMLDVAHERGLIS